MEESRPTDPAPAGCRPANASALSGGTLGEVSPTTNDDRAKSEPGAGNGNAGTASVELTAVELEILALAGKGWKYAGAKESAIRDQFGISATRFYQVLDAAIDRPAALEADPVLGNRLLRLRQLRADQRGGKSAAETGACPTEP